MICCTLGTCTDLQADFSKIDAEKRQWTLAPNQKKDTLPTATETSSTATETVPVAAEMVPTATETVPITTETVLRAAEMVPTAEPKERKLSENNHPVLYRKLKEHSAKWREFGIHLGFRPSELDVIEARPLLLNNAPKSWLGAMLSEWLQWTPGDQRGSTSYATLEQLINVLKEIGLSETAYSIDL